MKTLVPLLATLMLAAAPAAANAQLVLGRVTDHASGDALAGVEVQLVEESGGESATAVSDSAGLFELRVGRSGSYRLRASLLGYRTFTSEPLELATGEMIEAMLELSVDPVELTPVIVRTRPDRGRLAEYDRRREAGGAGHFITREDIERRTISTVSELLVVVPTVTLEPIRLNGIPQDRYTVMLRGTAGPCVAHLFINGVQATMSGSRAIDDILVTDWLEGVEVYPTSGVAPPAYRREGCGSVLFWMREPERGIRWGWLKAAAAAVFVGAAVVLTR
jgi:hypothetical protein